ncbi:tetraketide alpha-pyrone reductase 1-like [Lycium barbarum]|uniref:tetraketide alpha-pyrone reductase 1-like n=1 Tax=Lycium barbarum TaxID=112863 RepID=UPI00293F28C8|nr:tetraketide alpha-pyrone reductase 1-like [Lycium barbarum]
MTVYINCIYLEIEVVNVLDYDAMLWGELFVRFQKMNRKGNQKKVGHLWKLQGTKERLCPVKANLTDEGSFDDAIMGCEGVFHTASPVLGKPTFDATVVILNPAVDGTLNVLRSCKKNPRLRRVVLTSSSSTARVRADIDPNIPLDESSWSSVEFCK